MSPVISVHANPVGDDQRFIVCIVRCLDLFLVVTVVLGHFKTFGLLCFDGTGLRSKSRENRSVCKDLDLLRQSNDYCGCLQADRQGSS